MILTCIRYILGELNKWKKVGGVKPVILTSSRYKDNGKHLLQIQKDSQRRRMRVSSKGFIVPNAKLIKPALWDILVVVHCSPK